MNPCAIKHLLGFQVEEQPSPSIDPEHYLDISAGREGAFGDRNPPIAISAFARASTHRLAPRRVEQRRVRVGDL